MKTRSELQRILITGATGGIGQALAREYAGVGRTLVLHGRDEARINLLAQECASLGASVETLVFDLSRHDATETWQATLAALPPLDLVLVNAGVTSHIGRQAEGESWRAIAETVDINLYSAMATVSAVLPAMRKRGKGQIALISSLSAWYGLPLTPSYCAAKAGLKTYGESLRGWLASEGISVNVVLPGFVATGMSDQFPGPRPFMLTPVQAARRIARGLQRDQARISFPFPLNLSMWGLAVLPSWLSQRLLQWTGFGR